MLAGNGPSEEALNGAGAEISEPAESFGDRLVGRVMRRQSQLVLGLDPDPARLWPHALDAVGGVDETSAPPAVRAERAARAVAAHCRLLIDAAGEHCVAVKPQVACFERLGAPGWDALAEVVAYAQAADLLVIADAKRGDIGVSAEAYGQAFFGETPTPFGPVPGLGVDALTVSPWLGADSLEPFVEAARHREGGLFVLARNSNPGAAELQDRELDGGSVSLLVARMITELGKASVGNSGLSSVGAVVGATAPHRLAELRAAMPHAVFLLPGVGAQGGRVEQLAAAFTPSPAAGLISASRGIVYAHERDGLAPADSAAREAARLRDSAWRLVSRS